MLTAKQPEIGKLIRELREEMGLTKEKFPALLGDPVPTMNPGENRRSQTKLTVKLSPVPKGQLIRQWGKRS